MHSHPSCVRREIVIKIGFLIIKYIIPTNTFIPGWRAPQIMGLKNRRGYVTSRILGIVPFVATHLKGQFFVFFKVAFFLFLAPVGGSNPARPIA